MRGASDPSSTSCDNSSDAASRAAPDQSLKALVLTRSHRAVVPAERARIERAGGFVSADGRLGGKLELSRSLGDVALRRLGLSSVPDVTAFTVTPRDRFFVLGCDGFWGALAWDVLTWEARCQEYVTTCLGSREHGNGSFSAQNKQRMRSFPIPLLSHSRAARTRTRTEWHDKYHFRLANTALSISYLHRCFPSRRCRCICRSRARKGRRDAQVCLQ